MYIILLFIVNSISAQIGGIIDTSRITNWNGAGLTFNIPYHVLDSSIFFNDYLSIDSTFADAALVAAIEAVEQDSMKKIILFKSGTYHFQNSISLPSNLIIKGVSSDSTKIIFNLNNQRKNCINITGSNGSAYIVAQSIVKGTNEIFVNTNDIENFADAKLVELFQGENEYGASSSGAKQYQRGQVLKIVSVTTNSIITEGTVRLSYNLFDQWNESLKVRPIFPVYQAGIEDLTVTREDQPPANGGSIINFGNAYNSWIYGVESTIGANYHVSINGSKNIEIKGSYFHHAYNYGGGGNGYGISIGGSSTDCLVENSIFESLRHSMIISTGANGNVFGYNASFNKPDGNWDEASISIHGHYAYLNLFEGNYAEFANEDFVWGQNGPFNTFFRNYIYHEGYIFNLIHNQELLIEEGNDSTNVVANLADVTALGNGDYLEANYIFDSLPENQFYNEFSYYNLSKPNFLSTEYSWPCFGLPPDESVAVNDSIPAVTRFYSTVKTVPGPEMLITKVNREGGIFPKTILLQNYPNPFNPETTISFILAVSAFVTLKIYDVLGREIATLVNAEKTSGYFQVKFDTYSIGDGLSSGIYFYTLIAGDLKISKKMVLLR